MKKLWFYIAGCVAGIAVIIWMLVLIFVNNANEEKKQNDLKNQNAVQNQNDLQNLNAVDAENQDDEQKIVNSDNREQNTVDKMSYYLRFENDKVVIYREPNKEFYDYADIKLDVLPPEIKEQIKLGLYIDGEDRLYDFLQTYSS